MGNEHFNWQRSIIVIIIHALVGGGGGEARRGKYYVYRLIRLEIMEKFVR
jgi:hypothetical protein